jgi:hypothetical protein
MMTLLLLSGGGCSLFVDTSGLGSAPAAQVKGEDGGEGGSSSSSSSGGVDAGGDGGAAPLSSSKYAAAVLADGPIGYWRIGSPNNARIQDETGRGNHLAVVGDGYSIAPIGALASDPDPAIRLNGRTTWFEALRPRDLDFIGTSLTVEAWAKPAAQQSGFELYQHLVGNTNGQGGARRGFLLYLVPSENKGAFEWGGAGGGYFDINVTYSPSGYVHFVGVYDRPANRIRLYFNGTEVGSRSVTGDLTPRNAEFIIGSDHGGNESVLNGEIDEVAVYDKALTQAQIAKHYATATQP